MTEAEQLYRNLLGRLKHEYGKIVLDVSARGDKVPAKVWTGFTDALSDTLKMADVVAASQMRWRGLHQQTEVPTDPTIDSPRGDSCSSCI